MNNGQGHIKGEEGGASFLSSDLRVICVIVVCLIFSFLAILLLRVINNIAVN